MEGAVGPTRASAARNITRCPLTDLCCIAAGAVAERLIVAAQEGQCRAHEIAKGDDVVVVAQGAHQKHGAVHADEGAGPDGLHLLVNVIRRKLQLKEAVDFL